MRQGFLVSVKVFIMLAKKTIKNQITDGECIVLRPLQKSRADEVRAKLAELGIGEEDVTSAVSWARKTA
jgi:hypothetical protein